MKIQLPNDSIATGYRRTGAYQYEQTFTSQSCGFSGTEREFIDRGYAYAYSDISKHMRLTKQESSK